MPSIGELFQDRNFLSMLAGTGARLGAGGAGEAIGVPTQQWIQSLATQEAVGKADAEKQKFNEQLLAILGGLTPKEMAGPTSMKIGPDKMTLDITTPSGVATANVGGETTTPTTPSPGKFDIRSILPFL